MCAIDTDDITALLAAGSDSSDVIQLMKQLGISRIEVEEIVAMCSESALENKTISELISVPESEESITSVFQDNADVKLSDCSYDEDSKSLYKELEDSNENEEELLEHYKKETEMLLHAFD